MMRSNVTTYDEINNKKRPDQANKPTNKQYNGDDDGDGNNARQLEANKTDSTVKIYRSDIQGYTYHPFQMASIC